MGIHSREVYSNFARSKLLVFGLYVFIIKTVCWAKRIYELKEKLITIGKVDSAGIRLKGFFATDVAAPINRGRDEYFINPPGSDRKHRSTANC